MLNWKTFLISSDHSAKIFIQGSDKHTSQIYQGGSDLSDSFFSYYHVAGNYTV